MTGFEDLFDLTFRKEENFGKLGKGAYVYTKENLYYAISDGVVLDKDNPPTHTEGEVTYGEGELLFIDKIGMAKLIEIE